VRSTDREQRRADRWTHGFDLSGRSDLVDDVTSGLWFASACVMTVAGTLARGRPCSVRDRRGVAPPEASISL
jgi:hypothetical protein